MTYEEFKQINEELNKSSVGIASTFFFHISDKEKERIPTIGVSENQLNFVSANSTVIGIGIKEDGSVDNIYDLFGQFVRLKIVTKSY